MSKLDTENLEALVKTGAHMVPGKVGTVASGAVTLWETMDTKEKKQELVTKLAARLGMTAGQLTARSSLVRAFLEDSDNAFQKNGTEWVGSTAGAIKGAAAGSAILPVAGTLAGGFVGGAFGGEIGNAVNNVMIDDPAPDLAGRMQRLCQACELYDKGERIDSALAFTAASANGLLLPSDYEKIGDDIAKGNMKIAANLNDHVLASRAMKLLGGRYKADAPNAAQIARVLDKGEIDPAEFLLDDAYLREARTHELGTHVTYDDVQSPNLPLTGGLHPNKGRDHT